jgi:hypothetical protein
VVGGFGDVKMVREVTAWHRVSHACKDQEAAELRLLTRFAYDNFGNPFCSIRFNRDWRTPTTIGIAFSIYEDRTFDRLPILADALMGTGCFNDDILNHCRQPGQHVRGCWVFDLVLGKS